MSQDGCGCCGCLVAYFNCLGCLGMVGLLFLGACLGVAVYFGVI